MQNSKLEYLVICVVLIVSVGFALANEHLVLNTPRSVLWFLVGFFLFIIITVFVRNLTRRDADPYEIINPLLAGYTLYSLMLPLNYLVTLEVVTFDIRIPGVASLPIYQYMMICIVGLFGLLIGYYIPLGKRYADKLPRWEISRRDLKWTALILMLYGLFSFGTNIAAYGGLSNYIGVGYGSQRYVIQREALHFGSGLEIIGIAAIIFIYLALIDRKRTWFVVQIGILCLIAYITLLIGQRRYVVYLLFMAFVVLNYRFIRVKLRWLLLFVALAYTFLFIYPYTRRLWSRVGFVQGFVETYNVAVRKPELMLPFSSGEFLPPSKVILEVLTDDGFQFHYGASYFTGVIRIVPRVGKIMPEVLERLSDWRMKRYYPGLYERGTNFTFFTVAEGYVNFGYIGAFFHMFIYGLFASILYTYFIRNRKKRFALFVYAAIFALVPIESMHAEFTQFIWYLSHIYLGPFLLILGTIKFMDYVSQIGKRP